MKTMTRRKFIGTTAKGIAAAWALSHFPESLIAQFQDPYAGISPGFQTFPVREILAKDFAGTLKMMAGMGYKEVEMCSPKGYEKIGYGPLVGMKTSDMRQVIHDAGLTCPSCHFGFGEFENDKLDQSIEFAKGLGLNDMICSTFWLPKTATLDDYKAAAAKLNAAAEKIKAAGMQTAFHNHSFEFVKLDGQLIYDVLLAEFDPALVKMQFQTEVINLGFKGPAYFSKYPGRFISAHLSDWTADKKQKPIGQGIIDWQEFFTAAKAAGIRTYFVEMDLATYRESAKYITGLKL